MTNTAWSVPIDLGSRRFLHPGPLLWLRTLGWMLALFFLIALASFPLSEALGDWLPSDGAWPLLSHASGAAAAIAVYALAVWAAEGRRPSELAARPAFAQTFTGLALGVAMFAVVMAIMMVGNLYSVSWLGSAPPWQAGGLAIESGVVEEILVRAVILRLLWRAFGPWPAFIVSAAVFGAGHLANPDSSLFAVFCIAVEAGVMLGAFYALTGRLWVSIGVHAGWNFTQGYLFGAAVSGGDFGPSLAKSTALPNLPVWLTGGTFGPEASLPGLLVCSAVGALTVWTAYKLGRFDKPAAPVV